MKHRKKIVIIGASSAIATHCAQIWVEQQPIDMILIGRDKGRLDRIAQDLRVRSPQSDIQALTAEFLNPQAISTIVADSVQSGRVDIVLIAHGMLPEQMQCQNQLQLCREALDINAISPVLYAEAFAQQMEKEDHGTLAVIGSVAGDRGRRSNYVYGAAKGLVTRYVEGLQHRFAQTGVIPILIKPGPTDTPMTAQFKDKGVKLARVDDVAREIVTGIAAGKKTIYTPRKWWLIMRVIRHLPDFIFNRMDI